MNLQHEKNNVSTGKNFHWKHITQLCVNHRVLSGNTKNSSNNKNNDNNNNYIIINTV